MIGNAFWGTHRTPEREAGGRQRNNREALSWINLFDTSTFPSNEKVDLLFMVTATGLSQANLTRPGISGLDIWASRLLTSKCVRFGCQEFYWGLENFVRKHLRSWRHRVLYESIVLEDVFCHEFAIIAARSRCSVIPCRTPII